MRRADRLFQIVQYLRGGRLTTAARLAEQLEVTPRIIYRDIAHLIGSGVPIEGEAGLGYVMKAGFDLPPLMFNETEIEALMQSEGVLIQPYWRSIYRHSRAGVMDADMHPTFEHHHYKWWLEA